MQNVNLTLWVGGFEKGSFDVMLWQYVYFYLLINCFSGQFGEILTKVCKICTSAARAILSKLRSIFARIWPEKQLISRLVPALWETLKLLNRFVNVDDLITVLTSFAVTSATKRPVTWLLSPNHWLTSPRAIRTAGTNIANYRCTGDIFHENTIFGLFDLS